MHFEEQDRENIGKVTKGESRIVTAASIDHG